MYSIDLSFVIVLTIGFLIYNPIMTLIFVKRRYNGNIKFGNVSSDKTELLIFLMAFIGQLIFTVFKDPSIWWLIYFVTITTLVLVDKFEKRHSSKKHNH